MENILTSPKNTFANLPPAKQERIEAALVHEFATKGYQKASLNSVVRSVGIAKGSLYQYFDNKESLFLFVFDRFTGLVKKMAGRHDQLEGALDSFWDRVNHVLMAGLSFIDNYPQYYQLYLNVLFEHDIPRREELIAKVRLFSLEYFGPLAHAAQHRGELKSDVPVAMVVFIIDAVMDRFLQGYARSYLDGGLALSSMDKKELAVEVKAIIAGLKSGLAPR